MLATLIFAAALFVAPAIRGVRADFKVNGASLTQCQSAHFTWDASGSGPYSAFIVDSADSCGDALADLGDHKGTSMAWNVTLPAGKKVYLTVESPNDEGWSTEMTVQNSSDSSCLPQNLAANSSSSSTTAEPTTLTVGAASSATTSASGAGVPAGAANAGSLPASNGGPAATRVPVLGFATVFAAVAWIGL